MLSARFQRHFEISNLLCAQQLPGTVQPSVASIDEEALAVPPPLCIAETIVAFEVCEVRPANLKAHIDVWRQVGFQEIYV